jgi:glycyl-tRNA synthetase beta chain
MPQLLIELFSEEIPARMQTQAAKDFERMARERLAEAGLLPEAVKAFAGPRRLTLVAEGLPVAQKERHEELKGPRVGSPPQAMDGFLRKAGLTQDQLTERDGVWYAHIHKPGRATTEIVAEMVETIVRGFPWPKSMKWGTGTLRWVRPLKRILCVFDREIVPFSIDGVASGDVTEGHRFMGVRETFRVRDFEDYCDGLAAHFVVLDVEERKARILEGARTLCFARNLELVEDEGLLEEVAGLAEWPTPILGDMDPAFLDLPPEVIRTSMRTHQKYFAIRKPGQSGLAAHFLVVSNIEATDGGLEIARGNAKVLSSRLSDARFFWDEDIKVGFDAWLEKLNGVTFHAKLGTMAERVERIVAAAREIALLVGADPDLAATAARYAKADLSSEMVGEFPELQGLMGGYYAKAVGFDPAVVAAIQDHYRPQGPADAVPTAPVSVAVALADKLDTLVGFFAIDEKPTGSKDPFALRRAALGVIRIILENGVRLPIRPQLLAFFADRLKVLLRDQGKRHDLVDAVFALGDDDLVRIVARVEALDAFLKTEDGANLLAGYRRASNILKAEEKKGPLPEGAPVHVASPAQEGALYDVLMEVGPKLNAALVDEDFGTAMTALAALRSPVDSFFEGVLVNSDVAAERANRLKILRSVRGAMERVADFSLVTV